MNLDTRLVKGLFWTHVIYLAEKCKRQIKKKITQSLAILHAKKNGLSVGIVH